MDRQDNLPRRPPPSTRHINAPTNLTSSSSSSSTTSFASSSPPDFLRQVYAVLKQRKPLGESARAVRMIDPLGKQALSSTAFALPSNPKSDNCVPGAEMVRIQENASLAAFSSSLKLESQVDGKSDGIKQVQSSSALSEQPTFQSK